MADPLIVVKKADGTTVRLPLSEVKKMSAQTSAASKPEAPETAPAASVTPAKSTFKIPVPEDAMVANGVKLSDPMAEVKKLLSVNELPAAPVEPLIPTTFSTSTAPSEPHLLHEELEPHEVKHPDLVAHVSYEDSALAAAKTAEINLAPELLDRFHSLTSSLYKGIRTLDQVLAYATLPGPQGGLGLSLAETERLKAALAALPGTPKMVTKPKAQAMPPAEVMPPKPAKTLQPLGQRLPMRDVEPPAPAHRALEVMGPVEEMKNFNLTDWRRLAATPEKAKDLMIAKFISLKNESYFLYQDARTGWYASPLLTMYQKLVVDALNAGERLSDWSQKHGRNPQTEISAADVSAIVEINQSLAV